MIEHLEEEVRLRGSIFQGGINSWDDIDAILGRLRRAKRDSYVFYCSSILYPDIKNLVAVQPCSFSGLFNKKEERGTDFISEMSFSRLGVDIHVVVKPIIDSLIVPSGSYTVEECCLIELQV